MIRSALHETSAGFSARSSPNASQLFSLLAQPFSPDPFWPADKCIRWTRKLVDIPWCVRTLTPPFGSRRFSREPEGSAVKKEEEAGPSHQREQVHVRDVYQQILTYIRASGLALEECF